MQTLTTHLLSSGLVNHFLTDSLLAHTLEGSSQRRYHLVNRAMKAQELISLRRGLYVVSNQYREQPCHAFAAAQALVPGAYVSLETALAHHQWIPESVYSTTCIAPSRKSYGYQHDTLGQFTYRPLAVQKGHFLELVEHTRLNNQGTLIARPFRALMDLICIKKIEWQGMDWLENSLRIDRESLEIITPSDVDTLKKTYKHKRVHNFLSELAISLDLK